jgi:hypothetical protein
LEWKSVIWSLRRELLLPSEPREEAVEWR